MHYRIKMTSVEFVTVIAGGIVSLGGGGAIVLGLSNYFGQLLAKRYEEKIKAQYQNEVNEYQAQLDVIKQTTLRYSDKQFEHYNQLWSSLLDMRLLSDKLWESATSQNLDSFSKQLKATRNEIERASLFIEDAHYLELMELVRFFSEYEVGKSKLITFRQNQHFSQLDINTMIAENAVMKIRFEQVILLVKVDLKKQIGGKA